MQRPGMGKPRAHPQGPDVSGLGRDDLVLAGFVRLNHLRWRIVQTEADVRVVSCMLHLTIGLDGCCGRSGMYAVTYWMVLCCLLPYKTAPGKSHAGMSWTSLLAPSRNGHAIQY